MIFIERYPLKRCQGCVKLIASKVNCFLNITDLSEVQFCMSSITAGPESVPHTKDGADHVPLIFLSSVYCLFKSLCSHGSMQLCLHFNILNFGCTFLYQHRREYQNLTFYIIKIAVNT